MDVGHWPSSAKRVRGVSRACVKLARGAALILLGAAIGGCTFMGRDQPAQRRGIDFGPPQDVNICVLLDDGVSQHDADALLSAWSTEASKYALSLRPVSYQALPRSGFFHSQIMNGLDRLALGPSCDRLIYFVNRNAADYGYGLASLALGLPEVLGEVDDQTLTRGFVVAALASPSQIVMTPTRVARHEIYHLLGCYEHFDMTDCYRQIHDLKAVELRLRTEGYYASVGEEPFYPTYASRSDAMLISRAQVNRYKDTVPSPRSIETAAR
jgi:hypothetical protein